jgi:hypothetical protein
MSDPLLSMGAFWIGAGFSRFAALPIWASVTLLVVGFVAMLVAFIT